MMKSSGKFGRLARRLTLAAGTAAVALTSTAGLQLLGGGVAHASTVPPTSLISNESWLNIGIRGGSTSAGTDAIQWWADGGPEQLWSIYYYGNNSSAWYFQNSNSGLCLTTDGVAGDALTQEPCDPGNVHQQWSFSFDQFYDGYTIYNRDSGLNMDIQGASYWAGAELDAWYPNNGLNQVFSSPSGYGPLSVYP